MSPEQLELLKRIQAAGLFNRSELSPEEVKIAYYLNQQRYIAPKGIPHDNNHYYQITELGKSKLYNLHQSDFRFWFPIAVSNLISFAALVISIIALLQA